MHKENSWRNFVVMKNVLWVLYKNPICEFPISTMSNQTFARNEFEIYLSPGGQGSKGRTKIKN